MKNLKKLYHYDNKQLKNIVLSPLNVKFRAKALEILTKRNFYEGLLVKE